MNAERDRPDSLEMSPSAHDAERTPAQLSKAAAQKVTDPCPVQRGEVGPQENGVLARQRRRRLRSLSCSPFLIGFVETEFVFPAPRVV